MKDEMQQQRIWAVQRFLNGEKAESVCASLHRSKPWLYKWVERHLGGGEDWSRSRSRRPFTMPTHTAPEVEEIVKMLRLNLYNRGLFCGGQAIRWEIEEWGVRPLPSIRTIHRILSRNRLTHRQTGLYEAKGKVYPKLPSLWPHQTHQADLVGPCYLKGPLHFSSLNGVDITTGRCGIHPSYSKSGQSVIDALWAIWKRLDNELSFYGSPTYPRGMGPVIRLCLHHRGWNPGLFPWPSRGAMEWWRNLTTTISNCSFARSRWRAKEIFLSNRSPSSSGTTAVTATANWVEKRP